MLVVLIKKNEQLESDKSKYGRFDPDGIISDVHSIWEYRVDGIIELTTRQTIYRVDSCTTCVMCVWSNLSNFKLL